MELIKYHTQQTFAWKTDEVRAHGKFLMGVHPAIQIKIRCQHLTADSHAMLRNARTVYNAIDLNLGYLSALAPSTGTRLM